MKVGDLVKASESIHTAIDDVEEGTYGVIFKQDKGWTGQFTHIALFADGICAYVNDKTVKVIPKSDIKVSMGAIIENR